MYQVPNLIDIFFIINSFRIFLNLIFYIFNIYTRESFVYLIFFIIHVFNICKKNVKKINNSDKKKQNLTLPAINTFNIKSACSAQ